MSRTGKYLLSAVAAAAGVAVSTGVLIRRRRRMDLSGRTVLITGGSRGLGLELAREFGREGARVAICARDRAELVRAKRDLVGRGIPTLAIACDLTVPDQIGWMVEELRRHWGPADVLVNNAGVIVVGPMETMTVADYEEALALHFWAPLHAMRAVVPDMRRQGGGRIVNISSIGGKIGVPHLAPYCASKFALAGLSETARAELAKDNVLVTTVYPGLMRTGSQRNAIFKGRHREEHTWFTVTGSLPILSMNAERAARQIVRACRRGASDAVLSGPAILIARLHDVIPGLFAVGRTLAGRALPRPGGIGTRRARGKDSRSTAVPSFLTRLTDRAAVRNNQGIDGTPA